MSVNTRLISAPPEAVFAVLSNGWLYPVWVVGASRMRAVDDKWPAVGARIHHSVGVWPALIDDSTSVLEWDPPRRAVLQARLWPVGEATVSLDVERSGEQACTVTMTETPSSGPLAWLPGPAAEVPIKVRNVEALRRLAYLAEGRAD
ncbi:SRPBCC family protein [Ornithinimicrobium tianjinense]|uniref:Polyketide cyclase n=1 Tax=Ornithinimicrobium tianjinense TaxID=1195761 RepID=A0A917BC17_9MICO|nr:SRPBCC family protein [Ornithinimicrobium tianjinense]GGF36720.1 polyketide cyclase [Ornithinimicrobium tianjinense]